MIDDLRLAITTNKIPDLLGDFFDLILKVIIFIF